LTAAARLDAVGAAPAHRKTDASRAAVDAAVAQSHLAALAPELREELLADSRVISIPSRTYFVREGDPPRLGLLVTGMIRAFRVSTDGRELTLAWSARSGVFFNMPSVVASPTPWSFQAVSDSVALDLSIARWREVAQRDVRVAWMIARFGDRTLRYAVNEVMGYAYGNLRRRVIERLLDLGMHSPGDGALIASVTQEELAVAVGATRPSVARVLHDLRADGSVRSLYRGILIQRPEALAAELAP
jgi:CRP/FNR family cyclic AMP-dependent transcriptional regulator